MKKNVFFGMTQGSMWAFISALAGFELINWQWWAIFVTGIIMWTIIYHKVCKD